MVWQYWWHLTRFQVTTEPVRFVVQSGESRCRGVEEPQAVYPRAWPCSLTVPCVGRHSHFLSFSDVTKYSFDFLSCFCPAIQKQTVQNGQWARFGLRVMVRGPQLQTRYTWKEHSSGSPPTFPSATVVIHYHLHWHILFLQYCERTI